MKQIETQTRRRALKTISTGVVGGLVITGGASAQANGDLKRELSEVRAATADYHDPENAIEDGYLPETDAVCGMGYHYPHEDFVEAIQAFEAGNSKPLVDYLDDIERTDPPVLVYGETDEGLVLGAVEYLTLDPSTNLFDATEDDEWHPFIGPTYALHAWVHQPNPEGVFNPTNPRHQFTKPEWCEDGGGDH